jgi:GNAT superfamily N-acetyltransferase
MDKTYYSDDLIVIRSMKSDDTQEIYHILEIQNHHPRLEVFEERYKAQERQELLAFIAQFHDGRLAGYVFLYPNAAEGPFGGKGIPEIVDLHVFIEHQRKGIANKFLDTAEEAAAQISDKVYLGVGVHSGYGAAHRIYFKRGYMPDGTGVWYKGRQLEQYADCRNDDELVLFLSKEL